MKALPLESVVLLALAAVALAVRRTAADRGEAFGADEAVQLDADHALGVLLEADEDLVGLCAVGGVLGESDDVGVTVWYLVSGHGGLCLWEVPPVFLPGGCV